MIGFENASSILQVLNYIDSVSTYEAEDAKDKLICCLGEKLKEQIPTSGYVIISAWDKLEGYEKEQIFEKCLRFQSLIQGGIEEAELQYGIKCELSEQSEFLFSFLEDNFYIGEVNKIYHQTQIIDFLPQESRKENLTQKYIVKDKLSRKSVMKHGFGACIYANGDICQGQFQLGKLSGQVIKNFQNGDVYIGQADDDELNGQGVMVYSNGDRFQGVWMNNEPYEGQGVIHYSDSHYSGSIISGQKQGYGLLISEEGNTYSGYFVNDKFEGQGHFNTIEGGYYEGEFRNGKKQGHGIQYTSENGRFEGTWNEDLFNGEGVYYFPDGSKLEGTWENGKKNGSFKFTKMKDNIIEQAVFENDIVREYSGDYELNQTT